MHQILSAEGTVQGQASPVGRLALVPKLCHHSVNHTAAEHLCVGDWLPADPTHMPLLPSVLWAQRADHLILTIDLQEAKSPNVKVDSSGGSGTVHYRGQAKSHATGAEFHDYELQLELYAEVESNDSQVSVTDRRVLLKVAKTKEEYWPRLLKSAGKVPNVKVDWSKWVDEDEEESKPQYDMGDLQNLSNFDLGAAGASGGGLGADALGGADEDDSDDEDLPDLESSS